MQRCVNARFWFLKRLTHPATHELLHNMIVDLWLILNRHFGCMIRSTVGCLLFVTVSCSWSSLPTWRRSVCEPVRISWWPHRDAANIYRTLLVVFQQPPSVADTLFARNRNPRQHFPTNRRRRIFSVAHICEKKNLSSILALWLDFTKDYSLSVRSFCSRAPTNCFRLGASEFQ